MIDKLVKAIHHWLNFQDLCGNNMLFSESFLGLPICEFLDHYQSGKVRPEYSHPILNRGRTGRPYQIDYAILDRNNNPLQAFEAKWLRNYIIEPQDILDDILRLECLRPRNNQYVARYFLIAGRSSHFERYFKQVDIMQQIFSFDQTNPKKTLAVRSSTGNIQEAYRSFSIRYGINVPVSFTTKLVIIEGTDITVAAWQVSSVPNRSLFSPDNVWPRAN